ncbi:MAG: hypothetical protein BGN87_01845 [Rhizobiales bacterium 65-79]|nr:MAG: hypothetical protein BGN87_01845 [Rhizobiales bacterium 65-79]
MGFPLVWRRRFHDVPIMNQHDRPSKVSFAYKQIADEMGGHNLEGIRPARREDCTPIANPGAATWQ